MKKILISMWIAVFLLGIDDVNNVVAQEKKINYFNNPNKAKNVQISRKKILTDSQRKILDEIEKTTKGKPIKPLPVIDPTIGGATGVLGEALPTGGQKYAILIGLANYSGTVNDLCVELAKTKENFPTAEDGLSYYCKDEDALNMKKALVEEYGYEDDGQHIFIFSDANAKFDTIKSKIDELVGTMESPGILTENDELVFFFSGHSAVGVTYDETGIVQLDADEDLDEAMVIYDQNYNEQDFINNIDGYADDYVNSEAAYIWDDQLKAWFANSPTNRIFFAFDTCRAGGMNDLELDGRILSMSSTEYQSSWTYYLGGAQTDVNVFQESEGLFAHYFVKRAMIDGLADGSNPLNKKDLKKYDGNVAVEEAFSYAYPIVKLASNNMQTPTLIDDFFNDLLLGYQIN